MDEDELEDILDVVGGFSKEHKNPPPIVRPKKELIPILPQLPESKPIQQKVVAEKMAIRGESTMANRNTTTEADVSNLKTNTPLRDTSTTSKKRHRKTKREGLMDKAKNHHGELMGNKYTSARTRKILIQLNKFIYPNLKNYQIMEFLLLQSIEQNQELLPPNFKDLI